MQLEQRHLISDQPVCIEVIPSVRMVSKDDYHLHAPNLFFWEQELKADPVAMAAAARFYFVHNTCSALPIPLGSFH
jgi:hypothetical protein